MAADPFPDELRIGVEEAVAPARQAWAAAERLADVRRVPGRLRGWWAQADALEKEVVVSVGLSVLLIAIAIGGEMVKRRLTAEDEATPAPVAEAPA